MLAQLESPAMSNIFVALLVRLAHGMQGPDLKRQGHVVGDRAPFRQNRILEGHTTVLRGHFQVHREATGMPCL